MVVVAGPCGLPSTLNCHSQVDELLNRDSFRWKEVLPEESQKIEYKVHHPKFDFSEMPYGSVRKYLNAFITTVGRVLVYGVKDKSWTVEGVELEAGDIDLLKLKISQVPERVSPMLHL